MISRDERIDLRILRDMSDAAFAIDTTGTILYMNNKTRDFLGLNHDCTGEKYASIFLNSEFHNDKFHQLVLDAIYNKDKSLTGIVPWCGENLKKTFKVTSSFLFSESNSERIGVVILFSDVTEVEKLNRQQKESSVIFAGIMILICSYLFFWSAARSFQWDIPLGGFSLIIQFMSLLLFFIVFKTTSFSTQDMGLRLFNVKSTILPDALIGLGGAVLLVIVKVVLLQIKPDFFPTEAPFFDWSRARISNLYYPVTVVWQEFLTRGAMQGSLQRIFTGKHAATIAILVSSLIFGVAHIAYGFQYMVGAVILLSFFGILYKKQGHIWGLCIIHYILGAMAELLRYTA